MQTWLRSKLDCITREFLDGGGYGAIFEVSYLSYLECMVATRRGAAQASKVWPEWGEVCTKATPEGEKVQCLSNRVTDREELVKALQEFQRRFEGPSRRAFKKPPKQEAQPQPPTRSGGGEAKEFDLFDFLSGD